MKIKCPNCSAEVEYIEDECVFCEECGQDLKCDTAENTDHKIVTENDIRDVVAADRTSPKEKVYSAANSANTQENLFDPDYFKKLAAKIGINSTPIENLAASSKYMSDNLDRMNFSAEAMASDCEYLDVEYNRNLFFLSGSNAVMKLRITPLKNELQKILLFMEVQKFDQNIRREIPVDEMVMRNRQITLQVPYTPEQMSGRVTIVFYVGCKTAKGCSYYKFSVEHKIYDPNQSGSSLGQQVIINNSYVAEQGSTIDTSIHAHEAGTIQYRNIVEDAIKQMGSNPSVHDLVDRLNDLPEWYERKQLVPTTWAPENIMIRGTRFPADKLVLEWNGKIFYLIQKNCVKFGRNADQVDIVVRSSNKSLGPRDYPNSTVSRLHTEIFYCDDVVTVMDHSTWGTYINERRPTGAGLPLAENAKFEFGDIHWQMNLQKCQMRHSHNICQTCTANKIKSMTFTPLENDGNEYYFLIWQCCELGLVIEELSNWTVFARDGYFFIRTPDQEFFHLRPGEPIVTGKNKFNVKYFQQF